MREDVGERECEVGNERKRRGGDKREGEEPSEREMGEVVGEREDAMALVPASTSTEVAVVEESG